MINNSCEIQSFHKFAPKQVYSRMTKNLDKAKILTIDDSPDMLYLEKMVLEAEGFEVFTADNAKAALEMLPHLHDISLILCDVQMDNMDGLEFVKTLEENHRDVFNETPVVLVTALDIPPEAKVAGYIRKPSDLNDFVSKVKSFLSPSKLTPV